MPSDADDNLEWIDITDFTPGIVGTTTGSGYNTLPIMGAGDGAANTMVNCVPGPSGMGLMGGPRRVGLATRGSADFPAISNPISGWDYYAVMDAMVSPNPVHRWLKTGFDYDVPGTVEYPHAAESNNANNSLVNPLREEIIWGTQVYNSNGAAGDTRLQRFKVQNLFNDVITDSISGSANQEVTNEEQLANNLGFAADNLHYGFMSAIPATSSPKGGFGWVCLMHNTAQIAPATGTPSILGLFPTPPATRSRLFYHRGSTAGGFVLPGSTLGTQSGWVEWSNNMNYDDGVTTGVQPEFGLRDAYEGYGDPILLFPHQGRIVSVDAGHNCVTGLGVANNNVVKGTWASYGMNTPGIDIPQIGVQGAQGLRFSRPLAQVGNGPSQFTRWTGYLGLIEPLGGVVSAASLDSSTLFVLGNNGAARISGDLGSGPQVTYLPTIPGAKGFGTHVIRTPVGMIFGTSSGAWLWSGGALPELLSPNLPPKFWVNDQHTQNYLWQQPKGRPAVSWPFLFFPNGWMCYLPTRTWSRIDVTDIGMLVLGRTAPFAERGALHYSQAPNGDVVGFTGRMNAAGSTENFLVRYDTSKESAYWSWKSQPIVRSRYRMLSCRELNIAFSASGSGNLWVDVQPEDGGGFTKTLAVTSTAAQQVRTIRLEISVDSPSFTIQLAWAGAGDENLLHVHRVSMGYRPAQSVQRY